MSAIQNLPLPGLRALIAHRESVEATDTLESVHQRFEKHEYEFMLVMDGGRCAGLCHRQKIGMVLGARFGFAMHSRRPVRESMLPEVTIIKVNQPLPEVLSIACSRPNASLYDDVVLVDEAGAALGVIFSRTLVRLQNELLRQNFEQLKAQNKEMEGDLHLAREIQLAMLPGQLPVMTGEKFSLRLHHHYESAGVVSGDFFHVMKISETALGIFICDVMGHGVRSAFVTAVLRALVEEMRHLGDRPAELLKRVNCELMCILKPMDSPLYATAYYVVADTALGEIRFAKAGHPHPLLLSRGGGAAQPLKCTTAKSGPALGMFKNACYCEGAHPLNSGDRVLLFTDGIFEVFDAAEQEYGTRRLAAALEKRRDLPAPELFAGLLAEARDFSATKTFDDDICLITLEAVATGLL